MVALTSGAIVACLTLLKHLENYFSLTSESSQKSAAFLSPVFLVPIVISDDGDARFYLFFDFFWLPFMSSRSCVRQVWD